MNAILAELTERTAMNTRVEIAPSRIASTERDSFRLPAGTGLALAALIGSVMWMGIFALML